MVDTTQYPYKTIVQILFNSGSTRYEGSGVMISPDEVLTASHVAYTQGIGVSTNITVTPGASAGTAPFGTFSGTVTHYMPIANANDLITASDSQIDYAVIHLSKPTTVGFMGLSANFGGGNTTVSGYPGYTGQQFDQTEYLTKTPGYTFLSGYTLGAGSSGGPAWITTASGPAVVGTTSAADSTGYGRYAAITNTELANLNAWIAQDDGTTVATPAGPAPTAQYTDTTTGATGTVTMASPPAGSPNYLQWQYIWASPDNVAIVSNAPNVFLHGGDGNDALQVSSGQNVLDGGTGSNFLTGGTGIDTFFTDARPTANVWNTLVNFHKGDAATLWGFVDGTSTYTWDSGVAGAAGSTGATLRANIVGGAGRTGNGIDASITFAGLSVAQAQNLQIATGGQGSSAYLYITNPGV